MRSQCNLYAEWLAIRSVALAMAWLGLCSFASAETPAYKPPLSAYVDISELPAGDMFEPGEGETRETLLSRISVDGFRYQEITESDIDVGATMSGSIIVRPASDGTSGIALKIPGVDAFELVTGTGAVAFSVTVRETETLDATTNYPLIATLTGVDLGLRLKGDFLQPVEEQLDGSYAAYTYDETKKHFVDEAANPIFTEFSTNADVIFRLTWDGETEVEFRSGNGVASFSGSHPFMVADSGVVVDVRGAALDLSTTSSPTAAPNPAWRGLVLEELSVAFTGELGMDPIDSDTSQNSANFILSNFTIGTGGFNGSIDGNFGTPVPVDLGGMDFELQKMGLTFQQNAITASDINGVVRDFPFFEQDVKLDLALDLAGNFKAGIAADDASRDSDGLVSWEIDGAVELVVDSIAFELTDRVFYTTINGEFELLFLGDSNNADVNMEEDEDVKIPVDNLRISSKGEVSLDGGWVTLPEKRILDFNAFGVTLSQVGFGFDGDDRWVGFSGGVELVGGLSSNAKFKKLQFSWAKGGGSVSHRLQGVEVGFEKPNVVKFNGSVDWFENSSNKGFAGTLRTELDFIKTVVSSRLVIGETLPGGGTTSTGTCDPPIGGDPFKFFYLDLEASLASGLPLFGNVSLYGYSGLLAVGMEPNICAFDKPLNWFKAHLNSTNIVDGAPPPWSPEAGAFAVGLGAQLGTTADNGFTLNSKIALTVAVPGPVVIFTGQGNVLTERGDLKAANDPLFLATAIYDGNRPSLLFNLGIYYNIPNNGLVASLSAETEAFFNLVEPNDWYLYMGQKDPTSKRISATTLSLLPTNAYYMVDPKGLAFGGFAGKNSGEDWIFGPLTVQLSAWLGFDAALAWRPIHVWGAADMGGLIDLAAFGFGVGITANANLEVSSPTPFLIDGKFNVALKLPWPLPDPEATVHLRWEKKAVPEPLDNLVARMGLEASKETATVAAAIERGTTVGSGHSIPTSTLCSPSASLANKPPGLGAGSCSTGRPLVPVTYRPVVAFERSTNDLLSGTDQPKLVGNVNGHKDVISNSTFRYNLTSLKLWATPLSAGTSQNFNTVLPEVYGVWPPYVGNPGRPAALSTKLWSKNPFTAYDSSTFIAYNEDDDPESWTDWVSGIYGDWPCPPPDDEDVEVPDEPDGEEERPSGLAWLSMAAHAQDVPEGFEQPNNDQIIVTGSRRRNTSFVDVVRSSDELSAQECFDPSILNQKDLVLPPYHAFALAVESSVSVTGPGASDTYRDVGYFYTAGPPLNLDKFVDYTIPASLNFRLYRSYRVGLRFNETYMDLLYKEPGSQQELLYKDPQQRLIFEIIDENGNPATDSEGNPVMVSTEWTQAPDHINTRNDQKLTELLASKGIFSGVQQTDDMVYGWPAYADALKPGVLYNARVWFEDDRLISDPRLNDPKWLTANQVRETAGHKVLLFEYPFIASYFEQFSDLAASYEGSWFHLDTSNFNDTDVLQLLAESTNRANKPAAVKNDSSGFIGWYFAHGRPDLSIEAAGSAAISDALQRIPGYADDFLTLNETDIGAIRTEWQEELSSFSEVSSAIGIDRSREPLPEKTEISLISDGTTNRGILIESPEGMEWPRIEASLEYRPVNSASWAPRNASVVAGHAGARAFVFDKTGGNLQSLQDGAYRVTLTYKREIGSRVPSFVRTDPNTGDADGQSEEQAIFVLNLPGDQVMAEAMP